MAEDLDPNPMHRLNTLSRMTEVTHSRCDSQVDGTSMSDSSGWPLITSMT